MNLFFSDKHRGRKDKKRFVYNEFSDMLVNILSNIYIKNNKEALENETLESSTNYDIYISALEKTDNFSSHHYTLRDVKELNIGDQDLEFLYASDSNEIPNHLRTRVLEIKRAHIIDDFEEMNNYYRSIIGLPPYQDDSQNIYLDDEALDLSRLYVEDLSLPLHQQPSYIQDLLNHEGIIDILKEKYKYTYLNFLGSNSIPLRVARDGNDFELLRCNPNNVDQSLLSSFKRLYYINRNYLMNVFLIDYSYKTQELYQPFFSMMIVMVTINSLISENLENIVGREYIDDYNYDVFLESYKLHSMKDLPLNYKRTLVKNFNYLIKYKGSDKVIVDICKLFGFNNITLMKTYLCKTHKLDGDSKPLFRTMEDEDGNTVPDYDFMYDLKFIDIPYDSHNIAKDIAESDVVLDYDVLAYNDNYWGGGELSKEALYQDIMKLNFNQVLTKYVSLNNMYNITDLSFEASYVFSLIFKLRMNLSAVTINLGRVLNSSVPLFDCIIYLYNILMRKYNYTGEIIGTFNTNLEFKGFDINSDMAYLKKIVRELNLDINLDRLTYAGATSDISIIEEVYLRCKDLRDRVYEMMINSENITEYRKLKSIYEGICHTKLTRDIYRKSDGMTAKTYKELLEDINPTLNHRLEEYIDDDNITSELTYILTVLDDSINQGGLEYLFENIESYEVHRIQENLYRIINFFKAHTVQLRDMNTIYTIDDKYNNYIKAVDQVMRSCLTHRQLYFKIALDTFRDIHRIDTSSASVISKLIVDKVTKVIKTSVDIYNDMSKNILRGMNLNVEIETWNVRDVAKSRVDALRIIERNIKENHSYIGFNISHSTDIESINSLRGMNDMIDIYKSYITKTNNKDMIDTVRVLERDIKENHSYTEFNISHSTDIESINILRNVNDMINIYKSYITKTNNKDMVEAIKVLDNYIFPKVTVLNSTHIDRVDEEFNAEVIKTGSSIMNEMSDSIVSQSNKYYNDTFKITDVIAHILVNILDFDNIISRCEISREITKILKPSNIKVKPKVLRSGDNTHKDKISLNDGILIEYS